MSGRRIGVTGASGFIGGQLVRRLAARGDAVTAFQRTIPTSGNWSGTGPPVTVRRFCMPDEIDPGNFAGLDLVIHGALVEHGPSSRDSDVKNRMGTIRVLEATRAHGARAVFLSTLSAHAAATSHYGRNKLELERLFDPARDAVLKLGLVLGPGGLFAGMAGILRGSRIVPLPGGGRQPIQVLWIGDLEDAVLEVVDRGLTGTYEVAHPEVRTMRELYEVVSAGLGVAPRFMPVPVPLVEAGAAALEALQIPFPIRRENVLGLKQLRAWDTAPSMHALGIAHPVGLEEAVRRLFADNPPGR